MSGCDEYPFGARIAALLGLNEFATSGLTRRNKPQAAVLIHRATGRWPLGFNPAALRALSTAPKSPILCALVKSNRRRLTRRNWRWWVAASQPKRAIRCNWGAMTLQRMARRRRSQLFKVARIVSIEEMKKLVEEIGLRPAAKQLGINHSTLASRLRAYTHAKLTPRFREQPEAEPEPEAEPWRTIRRHENETRKQVGLPPLSDAEWAAEKQKTQECWRAMEKFWEPQ